MDNWRVSKKYIYDVHKSLVKKMCWQMLDKKDSPGPLFYLLDMSRGSLLLGCDCWSVVQNASVAIVFTLTFAPVLHSVCFDTYSIVIVLTSGHAADWSNTSVSCLVKLTLLYLATLTLVSLVL